MRRRLDKKAELAWARADVAAGVPSRLPTSCLTFSEQRLSATAATTDKADSQLQTALLFAALFGGFVACGCFGAKRQRERNKYLAVKGEEATALVDEVE